MIKLIAVGDINIGSDKSFIQKINYNLDLSKNFKNADICFANLEGPITNAGMNQLTEILVCIQNSECLSF